MSHTITGTPALRPPATTAYSHVRPGHRDELPADESWDETTVVEVYVPHGLRTREQPYPTVSSSAVTRDILPAGTRAQRMRRETLPIAPVAGGSR